MPAFPYHLDVSASKKEPPGPIGFGVSDSVDEPAGAGTSGIYLLDFRKISNRSTCSITLGKRSPI